MWKHSVQISISASSARVLPKRFLNHGFRLCLNTSLSISGFKMKIKAKFFQAVHGFYFLLDNTFKVKNYFYDNYHNTGVF